MFWKIGNKYSVSYFLQETITSFHPIFQNIAYGGMFLHPAVCYIFALLRLAIYGAWAWMMPLGSGAGSTIPLRILYFLLEVFNRRSRLDVEVPGLIFCFAGIENQRVYEIQDIDGLILLRMRFTSDFW